MYLAGGSIAGRRRLKTGPSATFHRRQPYPLEGVMDVPSGTVSARPKSLHAGNATKWGELLRLTSGRSAGCRKGRLRPSLRAGGTQWCQDLRRMSLEGSAQLQ